MPPKGEASASKAGGPMFSADTVAVLLMATGTTSISMAQYEMMSALDESRTASSFQHAFRSILQKAKDLKARQEAGEKFIAKTPSKKRAASSIDDEGTPSKSPFKSPVKKVKAEPKPRTPRKSKSASETNDTLDDKDANGTGKSPGPSASTKVVKDEPEWDDKDANGTGKSPGPSASTKVVKDEPEWDAGEFDSNFYGFDNPN